jgi:hypothetical protein
VARTPLYVGKQSGGMFSVVDVVAHPGSIFFVHSGTGTDGAGYGQNPEAPVATIDYAIGLCTANKGDVVYVLQGAARPRIDFDHANASIDVTANGCTLKNLVLLPSITTILIGVDIAAAVTDTLLEDVEVLPGEDGAGADEFVLGIDIKAGCSRTKITGLEYRMHASSAHANAGVSLTGQSDDVEIANSYIHVVGAAGVAPIKGITTLSTQVHIHDCVCYTDNEPGIELLTGTTGVLACNYVFSDLGSINAAIVADGCALFDNKYVEVGNESGATIGTASVDD